MSNSLADQIKRTVADELGKVEKERSIFTIQLSSQVIVGQVCGEADPNSDVFDIFGSFGLQEIAHVEFRIISVRYDAIKVWSRRGSVEDLLHSSS